MQGWEWRPRVPPWNCEDPQDGAVTEGRDRSTSTVLEDLWDGIPAGKEMEIPRWGAGREAAAPALCGFEGKLKRNKNPHPMKKTNPLTRFAHHSHSVLLQNCWIWGEFPPSASLKSSPGPRKNLLCLPSPLCGCFGVLFWLAAASSLHSERKRIFNSFI